jgi:predicted porin
MKYSTIAAAIALCSATSAFAQSNVTIYGVADVFAQYGKGNRSQVSLESGGLSGSRLGFKGTEDLGDGLKAIFQLESGVAFDTGTNTQGGRFWGRQAYVGLSSGWGSLTAGRQYVPQFLTMDATDPFGTGAGSAANSGIVSFPAVRADNSVAYGFPKLGDFSGSLLAAAGETNTGSQRNGNLYSADLHYAPGKLDLGLGLARMNRATDAGVASTYVLLTVCYDFDFLKATLGAQTVKNVTGAANTSDDRREYYGGVQVPVGAGSFSAAVYTGKVRDVDGTRATQYSIGYDYFLSKRTDLYVVGTAIKNGSLTAFTTDAATGAGPTVSAGVDAKALQFGIRHRF